MPLETIQDTRRLRLLLLIGEFGTQKALGKRLGSWSGCSYLSQLVNGHRNIGEKTARKIERVLGLHPGWMDMKVYN